MNKNSFLYTVIFSFIATFVLVLPLALANEVTKPTVDQNKKLTEAVAILNALDIPADTKDSQGTIASYNALRKYTISPEGTLLEVANSEIEEKSQVGFPITPLYFESEIGGESRYAGTFTGPALWGNVTLAIGFDQSLSRILGIQVVAQAETPGLGGRISDPWFTNQFKGQAVPQNGVIRFKSGDGTGDKNLQDDVVDGVTGATLTTNGVRDIISQAIATMKGLIGGGVQ